MYLTMYYAKCLAINVEKNSKIVVNYQLEHSIKVLPLGKTGGVIGITDVPKLTMGLNPNKPIKT